MQHVLYDLAMELFGFAGVKVYYCVEKKLYVI